jgi:predicted DNA-binding transcriptional regulator YafY
MMRAERLLSILMLLQRYRQMTARELSERLEVSERTIYRDLEALSASGVPVYAERGAGGGWFLPEEYRASLPALSEAELRALVLVNPQRLLADLGLEQVAETALTKLVAGLPPPSRRTAQEAWERLYVDFSGWNRSSEAIPLMRPIQEAVWQERKLLMTYQRANGELVERLVDPLGLVAKGNVWYLVATVNGDARTYRVSRVQKARVTSQVAARPDDFDLAEYWEQAEVEFKANLPRYPVLLRVDPSIVTRVRYGGRYARVEEIGEPEADGWMTIRMLFELEEDACAFALGFGPCLEVVEPVALREQVIALAQQTVARYARESEKGK